MPTLDAPPAMPLPSANSMVDTMNGFCLPKTFASCPKRSCGTELATTKELAFQMCFSAPPISAVIVGRAVMMIATSSPEMKDMMHNATTACCQSTSQRKFPVWFVFVSLQVPQNCVNFSLSAICHDQTLIVDVPQRVSKTSLVLRAGQSSM